MRELFFCQNASCQRRHCLCHPDGRHWRDLSLWGAPRATFDGITPCGGYISVKDRRLYGIGY